MPGNEETLISFSQNDHHGYLEYVLEFDHPTFVEEEWDIDLTLVNIYEDRLPYDVRPFTLNVKGQNIGGWYSLNIGNLTGQTWKPRRHTSMLYDRNSIKIAEVKDMKPDSNAKKPPNQTGLPQNWNVAGASTVGESHLRRNMPNQDAWACKHTTGRQPATILAVADGAGSAPRSDEGAKIAVETAVNTISQKITRRRLQSRSPRWTLRTNRANWRSLTPRQTPEHRRITRILREGIRRAYTAIANHAESENESPEAFATTLLLAVTTDRWIITAQVGDGAIVAVNTKNGQGRAICQAHTGEYANETLFITAKRSQKGATAHTGYVRTKDYDAIGITTDGMENLAVKATDRTPYHRFWLPIISWLQYSGEEHAVTNLKDLLNSGRVREKSSDDLTIVIAAKPNQQGDK